MIGPLFRPLLRLSAGLLVRPLRWAGLVMALAAFPAQALQILLTNDDGFETANLRALHGRLKAAGHDVIVAAPTRNNSGTGGWISFLKPVGPLEKDSRHGTVKAGSPGVGIDPADPDTHYVDGTPVMSLLYGLDVVAPKRWGRQPDLVISGPNEGNNLGAIVVSSGTVSNTLYAVNRGIASIAVSHENFRGRPATALADGAIEYEIADIVVRLVTAIEAAREGGELLPRGTGLNVNIPRFQPGEGAALAFTMTRVGTASSFQPVFFERLADSPLAVRMQAASDAPGISFVTPELPQVPQGVAIPADDSIESEANAIREKVVTISVIAGVPEAKAQDRARVRSRLGRLVQ